MISNILIQIVGFVGTGLYLLSYQFKSNRQLFAVQTGAYCFYFAHYFLLGAVTGAFSYLVNLLRSAFLSSNNKFLHSKTACATLCLLQVAILKFTWAGWISILPCVANIASTLGGYSGNARKVRTANMFVNSPLFIIYAIIVGSWAGVLDEVISEASIIISIARFGWKNLDRTDL